MKDFPFGNLRDALDKASTSEISLLMYYAPWDAESQQVRQELENVARHFFDKVSLQSKGCPKFTSVSIFFLHINTCLSGGCRAGVPNLFVPAAPPHIL